MTIDKFNFAGKKAIVRVDFNVPLDENGKITDDTRIRGALPTLKKVLADGGSLIIMSHMGKPKGKVNAKYSLSQIVDAVSEKLGVPVQFAPDCAKAGDAAAALKPGEVLLLENLRFYPEEEGKPVGIDKEDPAYEDAKKAMKASQKEFAKTLASYADCYINDAFGTAHRKHASTAVIADYFDADNKMLGYLMEKEVQAVDNILKDIKRPFTAIMGGSKVSTKIGIIENLMDKVDNLILCGGMTYTFAKAQGGKIGNSIVEDDKLDLALDIIAKAKAKGVNLVLGSDCVAADAFSNDAHTQVVPANNIPDGWEGLDAGPETQKEFAAAHGHAHDLAHGDHGHVHPHGEQPHPADQQHCAEEKQHQNGAVQRSHGDRQQQDNGSDGQHRGHGLPGLLDQLMIQVQVGPTPCFLVTQAPLSKGAVIAAGDDWRILHLLYGRKSRRSKRKFGEC